MTDQLTKLVKKMFSNDAYVKSNIGGNYLVDTREGVITINDIISLKKQGYSVTSIEADDGYIHVVGRLDS